MGEDHRVLDGLTATLAEVRGHGVGGVAEPGDPAVVQPGERGGQVVEVVLEEVGAVEAADAVQQGRNRVVPRAEAVVEFGAGVGRPGAGRGDRGGVEVEPAVGERGHTEPLATAPGLTHGRYPKVRGVHDGAPGGLAEVVQPRVGGEVGPAQRAVDSVGGDDQIRGQVQSHCRTDGRAAPVVVDTGDGGAVANGLRRQGGGQVAVKAGRGTAIGGTP